VVRAGVTQRRDLVRAKAMLDKVGAPVVGAVLNRVSPRETKRYYRSYSGYYGIGNGDGTGSRRRRTAPSARDAGPSTRQKVLCREAPGPQALSAHAPWCR